MATRAPFGTDLQPEQDVKLLGGKLVHVTREKSPAGVHCGGITATRVQRQIRHHGGGTHFPKRLLSVVREEEGAADQPPISSEKQLLCWPESSPEKHIRRQGKVGQPSELQLPALSSSDKANEATSFEHQPQRTKRKLREDGLVTAARKFKSRTFSSILDPAISSVRNKQRVLEDIFASCKRLDYQQLGVLDKSSALRAFHSFGVKLSEPDFTKLVGVSDCAVGEEHILYDKFCRILLGAVNGESSSLDEVLKKADTIQTPCASVESHSPASVEEFELSVGLNFPPKTPLTDKTNQLLQKGRENVQQYRGINSNNFRMAKTQPAMQKGLKLPPLSGGKLSYTTPLVSPREGGKEMWPPLHRAEPHNGMERLKNALLSCSDSKGGGLYAYK